MNNNVGTWGKQIETHYWDDRNFFYFLLLCVVNWPCLAACPPLSCSLIIPFNSTGGENKVEKQREEIQGLRQRQEDHLIITITVKPDSIWEEII